MRFLKIVATENPINADIQLLNNGMKTSVFPKDKLNKKTNDKKRNDANMSFIFLLEAFSGAPFPLLYQQNVFMDRYNVIKETTSNL